MKTANHVGKQTKKQKKNHAFQVKIKKGEWEEELIRDRKAKKWL